MPSTVNSSNHCDNHLIYWTPTVMPVTILGTLSLYLNVTFCISHFFSTKYYIFGGQELSYIYVELTQYLGYSIIKHRLLIWIIYIHLEEEITFNRLSKGVTPKIG